jgi:opacity protein-like surface antigen
MKSLVPAMFVAALAVPCVSFGQVAEFWVGGGESVMTNGAIGSTDPAGQPNDVQLTDGFRINFRLTLNTGTIFGHEVGYAYNRTQLKFADQNPPVEQGMAAHQGFYDFLLYATKEGSRIRPFAAGGVQFTNFVPPGSSASQGGGQTKFGINYGFGIKARVSSRFAIRADFRQYNMGKPFDLPLASGRLKQNEISAGFGFVL